MEDQSEIDKQGNLGFTWMESSDTEYLSWVGTLTKNGQFASETLLRARDSFMSPIALVTTAPSSLIPKTRHSGVPMNTSEPTAPATSGGHTSRPSRQNNS